MDFFAVALAALFASFLTFFSGFGLGTILTPVFAVFFPIEIAIMLTAIVHFLNNIFKFGLMFRWTNFNVLLWFGIPAIVGAFFGAESLSYLKEYNYHLGNFEMLGKTYDIFLLNLVIGILILFFAIAELMGLKKKAIRHSALIPGGLISGFFGGISGHQGALRSMFLINILKDKNAFIATGIAISLLVDITRLSVYFKKFDFSDVSENTNLIILAVVAAFGGALLGKRYLKKVSYRTVQLIVGTFLAIMGLGIGFGFI